MALYPSNTFKTFDYPMSMQSIFEDFNELFNEALYQPFSELEGSRRPKSHRRAPHHRYFSTAVKLTDFRADEVAVKVEDRKVRVQAKHQEGEDVSEVKKTVQLPEDVEADKVETRMTKEGFLVIRAPYNRQERHGDQAGDVSTSDWHGLRQLLRGPGITDIREHLVKDESGHSKFQVSVPVRDFHPHEISVSQVGDKVVVTAEHREERDGQLVHRKMHREFTMPQGVDKDRLMSRLSSHGVLTVEAPAPNLSLPEPKEIPVSHNRDNQGRVDRQQSDRRPSDSRQQDKQESDKENSEKMSQD